MMNDELDWMDARCPYPAKGYKPGSCDGLLFRLSIRGEVEAKCHRCHRIHAMPVETLMAMIQRRLAFST